MEMVITSPTKGYYIVRFDDEDYELIKKYKWYPAVSKKGKVYATTGIYDKGIQNSRPLLMHVLIMGGSGIDHKDHDGLNNHKRNLRPATQRQNAKNMSLSRLNKWGVKGATFDKNKKLYAAYITNDYKHIFLGYYSSLVDCAIKYNEAAIKYHGDFANINVLNDEIISNLRKFDLNIELIRRSGKTSKHKGVSFVDGRYNARITINNKTTFLGTFINEDDAVMAYKNAHNKIKNE